MEQEIIMTLVGTGSAAISSVITWALGRKRQNAETDHTLIEGMKDSLEFYEKLSEDTKSRLEQAFSERNELKIKIESQGKEIAELKSELLKLSISICYDLSCEMRMRKKVETEK